jgi:hypothetical protein
VLHGAAVTFKRNRPAIVVEAEERHRPHAVSAITEFLTEFGYAGLHHLDNDRQPIEEFDAAAHQTPANLGGWKDAGPPTGCISTTSSSSLKGLEGQLALSRHTSAAL